MKRLTIVVLVLVVVAVLALVVRGLWPDPVPALRVAKDTTFFLEPLNSDGTVNYVEALNAHFAKGVAPQNNAAVPYLQAVGPQGIGPESVSDDLRRRVFERMGMEPLPTDGPYLVTLSDFEEAHAGASTGPATRPGRRGELAKRLDAGLREGWSPEDERRLRAWLRLNEPAVPLLVEASRRERFHVPMVSRNDPPMVVGCPAAMGYPMQDAGRLFTLRAMLRVREGDLAGAVEDSLVGHRLGRAYGDYSQQIPGLIGMMVDREMSRVDAAIAADPRLSPELARHLLRQLRVLREFRSIGETSSLVDRCQALDAVMAFVRDGADPAFALRQGMAGLPRVDWNVMLRHMNGWFDRRAAAWRIPQYVERQRRVVEIDSELQEMGTGLEGYDSTGGPLGDLLGSPRAARHRMSILQAGYLLAFTTSGLSGDHPKQVQTAVEHQLAMVAVALALHRMERGGYPARLDDLVPDYLDEVPADLFTGGSLRYTTSGGGYVLYSLGPNGRDDGGRSHAGRDDRDEEYDVVVRVGGER